MDIKQYLIWFPELGETEEDAKLSHAASAQMAATNAADRQCSRDVEWCDHVVSVRLPGGELAVFDVTVRSEPIFEARERH